MAVPTLHSYGYIVMAVWQFYVTISVGADTKLVFVPSLDEYEESMVAVVIDVIEHVGKLRSFSVQPTPLLHPAHTTITPSTSASSAPSAYRRIEAITIIRAQSYCSAMTV